MRFDTAEMQKYHEALCKGIAKFHETFKIID